MVLLLLFYQHLITPGVQLQEGSSRPGVLKHFGARDPFQGKKNSKDPPHIYNSY